MEARSRHDHTLPPRRKRLIWLIWAVPVILALAFAGYHIWDLTLWNGRTGLALPIVDIESANRTIEENDQATVLDIRLHGAPSPARRTLRMPSMELVRRIDELEPYRDAPLFVLAATDAEAAARTKRGASR